MEMTWLNKVHETQTKSDIKMVLDNIQTQMDKDTQSLSEQIEQGFYKERVNCWSFDTRAFPAI